MWLELIKPSAVHSINSPLDTMWRAEKTPPPLNWDAITQKVNRHTTPHPPRPVRHTPYRAAAATVEADDDDDVGWQDRLFANLFPPTAVSAPPPILTVAPPLPSAPMIKLEEDVKQLTKQLATATTAKMDAELENTRQAEEVKKHHDTILAALVLQKESAIEEIHKQQQVVAKFRKTLQEKIKVKSADELKVVQDDLTAAENLLTMATNAKAVTDNNLVLETNKFNNQQKKLQQHKKEINARNRTMKTLKETLVISSKKLKRAKTERYNDELKNKTILATLQQSLTDKTIEIQQKSDECRVAKDEAERKFIETRDELVVAHTAALEKLNLEKEDLRLATTQGSTNATELGIKHTALETKFDEFKITSAKELKDLNINHGNALQNIREVWTKKYDVVENQQKATDGLLKTCNGKLTDINALLETCNTTQATLQRQIATLTNEKHQTAEQIEKTLKAHKLQISKLTKDIRLDAQNLQTKKEEFKKKQEELDNTINFLNTKLTNVKTERQHLVDEKKELVTKLAEANQTITTIKAEQTSFTKTIASLNTEIMTLTTTKQSAEQEQRQCSADLILEKASLEKTTRQIAWVKERLEALAALDGSEAKLPDMSYGPTTTADVPLDWQRDFETVIKGVIQKVRAWPGTSDAGISSQALAERSDSLDVALAFERGNWEAALKELEGKQAAQSNSLAEVTQQIYTLTTQLANDRTATTLANDLQFLGEKITQLQTSLATCETNNKDLLHYKTKWEESQQRVFGQEQLALTTIVETAVSSISEKIIDNGAIDDADAEKNIDTSPRTINTHQDDSAIEYYEPVNNNDYLIYQYWLAQFVADKYTKFETNADILQLFQSYNTAKPKLSKAIMDAIMKEDSAIELTFKECFKSVFTESPFSFEINATHNHMNYFFKWFDRVYNIGATITASTSPPDMDYNNWIDIIYNMRKREKISSTTSFNKKNTEPQYLSRFYANAIRIYYATNTYNDQRLIAYDSRNMVTSEDNLALSRLQGGITEFFKSQKSPNVFGSYPDSKWGLYNGTIMFMSILIETMAHWQRLGLPLEQVKGRRYFTSEKVKSSNELLAHKVTNILMHMMNWHDIITATLHVIVNPQMSIQQRTSITAHFLKDYINFVATNGADWLHFSPSDTIIRINHQRQTLTKDAIVVFPTVEVRTFTQWHQWFHIELNMESKLTYAHDMQKRLLSRFLNLKGVPLDTWTSKTTLNPDTKETYIAAELYDIFSTFDQGWLHDTSIFENTSPQHYKFTNESKIMSDSINFSNMRISELKTSPIKFKFATTLSSIEKDYDTFGFLFITLLNPFLEAMIKPKEATPLTSIVEAYQRLALYWKTYRRTKNRPMLLPLNKYFSTQ